MLLGRIFRIYYINKNTNYRRPLTIPSTLVSHLSLLIDRNLLQISSLTNLPSLLLILPVARTTYASRVSPCVDKNLLQIFTSFVLSSEIALAIRPRKHRGRKVET